MTRLKQALSCFLGLGAIAVLGACDGNGGGTNAGTGGSMPTSGVAATSGNPMAGSSGTINPMAGSSGASGDPAAGSSGASGNPAAGSSGTNGTPDYTPGSPTWSAIYPEIIQRSGCNASALCHGGEAAATGGNLSLVTKDQAHAALVGQAAMAVWIDPRFDPVGTVPSCADTGLTRVVPGDADASLLFLKISQEVPPCGDPMPQSGPLTAAEIAQIQTWIANGAMND